MATSSAHKAFKRTAFVPRIIFQAVAVAGVVPFCVVACGGTVIGQTPDAGSDVELTVACRTFDGGLCGVAVEGFDAADVQVGVANQGFDCGLPCQSDSVASIGFDASDAPLGVAMLGFDGGGPDGSHHG